MSSALKPLVDAVKKIDTTSTDATYEAILESIRAHGQLVPVLLGPGGEVIDGRLRMNALRELGIEPKTVRAANDEVSVWHATNMARRHLSTNERALIAAEMTKLRKRGANGRSAGISQGAAAAACGVSVDSIGRVNRILAEDPAMLPRIAGGASLPGLLREIQAKSHARKAARWARRNGAAKNALTNAIAAGVRASVIYADPPWDYDKPASKVTGAGNPRVAYPTMTLEQIKAVPVSKMADQDSVLWLWTPNCLIPQALGVMQAWGFRYVTSMVWQKRGGVPTLGSVRPMHETVLVGRRGAGVQHCGKQAAPSCYSDDRSRRGNHSVKPLWFAEQIERLYPRVAKVELFCRSPRKGWLAFGNQVNGKQGSTP